MQGIRIIEIPGCRMVSSGTGMFGEGKLERFSEWFSQFSQEIYSKDFLYWDGMGFCWLYLYDGRMEVPEEFDLVDFAGGLYAVATDIDQKTDMDALNREVDDFLKSNHLERDDSRFGLGNIITSPLARQALGYEQMDYYMPVKLRT